MANFLMIQGTSSDVGKSLLVTALCRIYQRRGIRVAPFKAQNMALNSFVTPGGAEIGRAQALQAVAACIEPDVLMNPVLIKPEGDMKAQLVVMGKSLMRYKAIDYYKEKNNLWQYVTKALDSLSEKYDLVIMEGAGSPAEINLKQNDIVNMRVAMYVHSPVLLAADIDRGGVFASLYGTIALLEPEEQKLIKGFLINKFRGDINLLTPGLDMISDLTEGRKTAGVIPYIKDLVLAQEDSVFLESIKQLNRGSHIIGILKFPHLSNYDDFDALVLEENIGLRFISKPSEVSSCDAFILPGSKMTMPDLEWMNETGMSEALINEVKSKKKPLLGICGGYQMLGKYITDASEVESHNNMPGLNLLDLASEFYETKTTCQVNALILPKNFEICGYEIHMGSAVLNNEKSFCTITNENIRRNEGARSDKYPVAGTYLHGVFDMPGFRRYWLESFGWKAVRDPFSLNEEREKQIDRLADTFEQHCNMDFIDALAGIK